MIYDSIPVLGMPVLDDEVYASQLVESLDFPVKEVFVIVNNPHREKEVISAIEDAAKKNSNVGKATFCLPKCNLGVAASWNLIIKARCLSPFWFICNADIRFASGDLIALVNEINETGLGSPCIFSLFAFGAFAINRQCVKHVGWFDEDFHPAYCEDVDYQIRMNYFGHLFKIIPSNTMHHGSKSQGSPRRPDGLVNMDYLKSKWSGNVDNATECSPAMMYSLHPCGPSIERLITNQRTVR